MKESARNLLAPLKLFGDFIVYMSSPLTISDEFWWAEKRTFERGDADNKLGIGIAVLAGLIKLG